MPSREGHRFAFLENEIDHRDLERRGEEEPFASFVDAMDQELETSLEAEPEFLVDLPLRRRTGRSTSSAEAKKARPIPKYVDASNDTSLDDSTASCGTISTRS